MAGRKLIFKEMSLGKLVNSQGTKDPWQPWYKRSIPMAGRKLIFKEMSLGKLVKVKEPKTHGSLGIKDPSLMNLAMSAKLLWRLITG
jgi:hypothetical protein